MFEVEVDASASVSTQLPATDPARDIVGTILELVPVSDWKFARPRAHGGYGETAFGTARSVTSGPHIEALRRTPPPYATGLTLRFADTRKQKPHEVVDFRNGADG